jgi:UDP-N-acetylglucosamine:LPS N-acetylglucosamine transferase
VRKKATEKRVLAVSSGGGHWIELLRIAPAFEDVDVAYVTVQRGYADDVGGRRFYVVNDATRWNRLAVALMALRLLVIIMWERPDVVITTGAAPGYFALRFGRRVKAKTIWVDSIANAEELSMSGRIAGRYADLWLTQWPQLADADGPEFAGAVL